MLDYLQKFTKLPKEIRDKINSPEVFAVIDELERKYNIKLAPTIIKIAVKEIDINGAEKYFSEEFGLNQERARQLVVELNDKIFKALENPAPKPASQAGQETHLIKYQMHEPALVAAPNSAQAQVNVKTEIKADKPAAIQGSGFFFSPDDEEEIRGLIQKIDAEPKQNDTKEKVEKILSELEINFGSEFLADRFKKIIETYLRGIRNRVDTKTTLMKTFEMGGLGLDDDSAFKILAVIDKYKASEPQITEKPQKIALPEDNLSALKNSGMRDVDYDFSALKQKNKETIKQENNEEAKQENKRQENNEAIKQLNNQAVKQENKIQEKPKEQVKEVKPEKKAPAIPLIRFAEAPGKIKMNDIKAPVSRPQVMTPIDELKYLDLTNFRRLSRESMVKAKDKIREKIRLLEEEGYDKRVLGIQAWRSNPINKLYLKIGEESISKNEPIDVIIEERKARGEDYLTNEEIEVIMDLNSEFRL